MEVSLDGVEMVYNLTLLTGVDGVRGSNDVLHSQAEPDESGDV